MDLNNLNKATKVGVWGLGITGKSTIEYLLNLQSSINLELFDQKELNQKDLDLLSLNKVKYNKNLDNFLQTNKYIIPSPGINLSDFKKFRSKFVQELDLFYSNWDKKIVSITGSVGKTSVTYLLNQILTHCFKKDIALGGNIGVSTLDLINKSKNSFKNSSFNKVALLELSSFQLENIKNFTSDLVIWTNFYPNHLDRHKSLKNYFNAKLQAIIKQKSHQKALLNFDLYNKIINISNLKNRNLSFFIDKFANKKDKLGNNLKSIFKKLKKLKKPYTLYTINSYNKIIKYYKKGKKILLDLNNSNNLINITYKSNWIIIAAACDMLNLDPKKILKYQNILLDNFKLEHRLEHINNNINKSIKFINDSKSTVPESTISAVNKLYNLQAKYGKIHLFLGGLSKGINRFSLIEALKDKVFCFYCFGQESDILYNCCLKLNLTAYKSKTLETVLNQCIKNIDQNSKNNNKATVLFSPAGSSLDQFENYKKRGEHFKALVTNYS